MDPRGLYFDERLMGVCAYCGARSDSRDHVPSRVLLDEPFPPDLPVVGACASCNNGFSLHERVVACLVDSLACGSTAAPALRPKVKRMLAEDDRLAAQMALALDYADRSWLVEDKSVGQVVTKLAKGHLAFMECPTSEPPTSARVAARPDLSAVQLRDFDDLPTPVFLPEIGTRAFMHWIDGAASWSVVQVGRYRYAALLGREHPAVRFVLSEYLFCEVSW